VNNTDDFEDLLQRIKTHRSGTMYYTPMDKGNPS